MHQVAKSRFHKHRACAFFIPTSRCSSTYSAISCQLDLWIFMFKNIYAILNHSYASMHCQAKSMGEKSGQESENFSSWSGLICIVLGWQFFYQVPSCSVTAPTKECKRKCLDSIIWYCFFDVDIFIFTEIPKHLIVYTFWQKKINQKITVPLDWTVL